MGISPSVFTNMLIWIWTFTLPSALSWARMAAMTWRIWPRQSPASLKVQAGIWTSMASLRMNDSGHVLFGADHHLFVTPLHRGAVVYMNFQAAQFHDVTHLHLALPELLALPSLAAIPVVLLRIAAGTDGQDFTA